jgi:hypothetical protein
MLAIQGVRIFLISNLDRQQLGSASILLALINSEQDVKPTARFANALLISKRHS